MNTNYARSWFATLALLSLVALTGCGKRNAGGPVINSRLAAVVSSDATVLADIKLDALRSTAFFNRHRDQFDFPMLKGMGQQIGVDPVHDLSEALVIWNGKDAVIAASGNFASDRAEAQLAKTSRPVIYKTARIYGSQSSALAFLDKGLIVAGSLPAVEKAVDAGESHAGGVPGELKKEFSAIPGAAQIVIASRGGLPFADMPMSTDVASALSNLAGYVSATGSGVTFGSGLQINSDITCMSEQGARRVNDAFRGSLGMARLSTRGDAMDLLRLWDAIQINQEQQQVIVKANLPDDLADQLLTRGLTLGAKGVGRRIPAN